VYTQYLGTRTFSSLNGIRGLCILSVLWHHAPGGLQGRIFERGFLGVDMFFVLSGFLIVTLLLRERDRTGQISLKNFYARRTLRIFPIYYLLLFSLSVYYLLTKPHSQPALGYFATLPFLLTYMSNWVDVQAGNIGVTWSLATEEQFYLGWPLVEKLFRPKGVALMLAAVLGVNQLINFGLLDGLVPTLYSRKLVLPVLQATFTPIALGVLLAHILNGPTTFRSVYRLLGHPAACVIVGGLLLALAGLWPGDMSGAGRLSIQLCMMLLLGTLVVREDHLARPILSFPPLAYLGATSYGIYLYHMSVIHAVRIGYARLGWPELSLGFYLIALAGTMVVAGLSYRFIEQPLLRLKARFAADAGTAEIPTSLAQRSALREASIARDADRLPAQVRARFS
jgi:peptidoglycan/LPS O-acetylase OafA/YrhL